jgi:hypothetical protein
MSINMTNQQIEAITDKKLLEDLAGVKEWFRRLDDAGVNFHPEESFAGFLNSQNGRLSFSLEEEKTLDAMMNAAREVANAAGADLSEIALKVTR